jgi:hypothetical protein
MPLKKFLNKMGLVEDEIPTTKAKTQPTQAPAASAPAAAPVSSMTSFSAMSYTPAPVVDPSIQEMLNQSLQENKLSGFDYLKFITAVEESRSSGVPEDARFKMTYSTAKQLGVDKNSLLKSGQHYVDVLAQDENDFNSDCDQYEKSQVTAREAKIAQIENTITDLNKQLSQLNQDHMTLSSELQQERIKLESRKVSFKVTLESFRGAIKSNIDKINQYLQ